MVRPLTANTISGDNGELVEALTPTFELASKKHDLRATAQEVADDFVVLAGSQARATWEGAHGHSYQALYHQLVTEGKLIPDGPRHMVFKDDHAFRSPSAASAVILGRQDNGRMSWRLKGTNKTYADWQNEQLAQVPTPEGD